MTSSSSAVPIDAVIRAWPEAMLLVTSRGEVRVANASARRLLHLSDDATIDRPLGELLGAGAAASLLPATGAGGACQIGADAATPGASVLSARSGRLPDGDFLVRIDEASDEHRLRSHLEHAERLASIGELLSSVAHELSNPLTAVLGYAELLLSDAASGVPRDELEMIQSEAMRCRRIVGNLLDLSRAEAFDPRPTSLADVVDRVIEFRAYAAQVSSVKLVRECDANVPTINGDMHRLVQAVLNLVTNAEDAVRSRKDGKRVVLRARRTASGGAAVEVEDNGPGVPAAIRDFIFEPFFTTKPRGRGTGLGLSLVRAAAKAHGGTVRVEDAPGGGARFVMELPAAG